MERASPKPPVLVHRHLYLFKRQQRAPRNGFEQAARFGERQPFSDPLEQLHTEFRFELFYVGRNGRLLQAQLLSGPRVIQMARSRQEDF